MAFSSPRTVPVSATLILLVLTACQDLEPPTQATSTKPSFAQGEGNVWTVNSLVDPGTGGCDDTECTLREAIAAAATTSAETQIVFQEGLAGTIPVTSTLVLRDMFTTIDGGGRITIDGQDQFRIMRVVRAVLSSANPSVTLKGLTLTRGRAIAMGPIEDMATYLGSAAAVLAEGAGLVLTLEDVTVSNSFADGSGGAMRIWDGASVAIRNSTFSGNRTPFDVWGGAIMIAGTQGQHGSLTVVSSTITGNSSGIGGGITSWGTLTVVGSTISRNRGEAFAGGIFNGDNSVATVVHSTISGNIGGSSEPGRGAGITNRGELNLRNSTVTLNQQIGPGSGGIASFDFFTDDARLYVMNSIVAGNTGETSDCLGDVFSLGNNLSTPGGGCTFAATGDITTPAAQLFTGALEQDLKDNGGPTDTHALIVRGAAVDAGSCPGETSDQRGSPRPDDDPGVPNAADGCDIGAYETVTPVADLRMMQEVSRIRTKQGEQLTYVIQVRNLGPETAPDVVVTNTLSSDVAFVRARSGIGTLTAPPPGETGIVTWSLGDLVNGAREVAEIEVTVLLRGKTSVTNIASVTGRVADPISANNSASITVSVNPGNGSK